MSFSDEFLGFWSKPKRRVLIAQWEQGLKEAGRLFESLWYMFEACLI